MASVRYGVKLLREFVGFARDNKAYWIVPLVMLLGAVSLLIVTGEAIVPLVYTLF